MSGQYMSRIQEVDWGVEQWVNAHGHDVPFTAADLASILGRDRWDVSHMLQEHRRAQSRGRTAYVVQGRGYGRAGRWTVLLKPQGDPKALQDQRRQAVVHSTGDVATRLVRDLVREVLPATRRNAQVDAVIQQVTPFMEVQMQALLAYVERAVTP